MDTGYFNSKLSRLLGSLTLAMVVVTLMSYTILNLRQAENVSEMLATISVDGTGEVLMVPDVGEFSFSVQAEGETASVAQDLSATKINDIIAYLKDQGIEEKDIKTANYNLYPKYRYEERVCAFNSYCPPGERIEDGFEVNQTVTVKVRKTDTAGDIIAGVGEKGATNISNLNFTIDDMDALRAEAREKAIADAKEKAKVLAKQLDVRIVRLVSYYENQGNYPQPYAKAMGGAYAEDSVMTAPELPVGEEGTTVMVNVTYEIR